MRTAIPRLGRILRYSAARLLDLPMACPAAARGHPVGAASSAQQGLPVGRRDAQRHPDSRCRRVGAAGGWGWVAAWVMLASRPRMCAISCVVASVAAAAAACPPSRASGGRSGMRQSRRWRRAATSRLM